MPRGKERQKIEERKRQERKGNKMCEEGRKKQMERRERKGKKTCVEGIKDKKQRERK